MTKSFTFVFKLMVLFFICPALLHSSEQSDSSAKSSISIKLVKDNFITISNKEHKNNRIGYRFFEHEPVVFGNVPLSASEANIDLDYIRNVENSFKNRTDVFVYKHQIDKDENWVEQTWTYYMVPVSDGIEIYLVVETGKEGLAEYYGIQQCFRLSGKTNEQWRREIAETPAFSEYDLWKKSQKSLSWVLRNNEWQSLPAGKDAVGAQTPLGLAIDDLIYNGEMPQNVGPYDALMLAPVDNGLVVRTDIGENYVCGIYWNSTSHVTNHHPADCLHSVVNIGNVPPFSKRMVQGKIYWLKGNKQDLLIRYQQDFQDSKKGMLRVAACQFSVAAGITDNAEWIKKQMKHARLQNVQLIQFPEGALSGYAGSDLSTFEGYDWSLLKEKSREIAALAKDLKMWVLLGSTHHLSDGNKPHNSLYVITPEGKVLDRYDKRFCTESDLKYYSPGDHFVVFDVNGVKCGLLICYDIRFPELYRQYSVLGVNAIFHSFYNARHKEDCIHPKIMPITGQARAAENGVYVSFTNSSAPYSWPCHFITPDGMIQKKLTRNIPGILISDIDLSKKYYDISAPFRLDAIKGKLNSGDIVQDPRSDKRNEF